MKTEQRLEDVQLVIIDETKDMVSYEPFILKNAHRSTIPQKPDFDELYYEHLFLTLKHLIYKYKKGWITSPRQVIYSSDECISTVHLIFDDNKNLTNIHIFQRSSNIVNLEEDVQFFNWFIHHGAMLSVEQAHKVETVHFVSMPHRFKNKKTKVDD